MSESNLLFKFPWKLVAAALLHPLPEVDVVEVLGSVVEEAGIFAEGADQHVLDRLVFPFRAFGEIVAVGHVGLMVLVVVIFEGLARHMGGERVVRIGKGRTVAGQR